MSSDPSKILLVTQRLSDFIEMKRAAVNLKKFGYHFTILFCGVGQKKYDKAVIHEINKAISEKIIHSKIVNTTFLTTLFYKRKIRIKKAKKRRLRTLSTNKKTSLIEKISRHPRKKILLKRWIQRHFYKKGITGARYYKYCLSALLIGGLPLLISYFFVANLIRATIIYFIKTFNILFIKPFNTLCGKVNEFISDQFKLLLIPSLYLTHYAHFKKIVKRDRFHLLILPEDIVGYVSPLLIKAGHKYKIPSLILPYTIANQEEAFQSLKNNDDFSLEKRANRLVGKIFKSWVLSDETHAVLRLPAGHVIGHYITRCSPPDPWMMNSSYANVIATENKRMFEYYQHAGISPKKMHITGANYDDYLAYYHANKQEQIKILYNDLGIQSAKPLLLIGGFPNQLTANPPNFDFNSVEEAVDFICNCLKPLLPHYEVVVRPHPNFQELASLFQVRNIPVSYIDTACLVPISDIYIAFASATIRWAIACGIPTINYDIFHYDFSDYKSVPGVINVSKYNEFQAAITALSQKDYIHQLRDQLETEKHNWGNMDGRSTDRIHELIQKLIHTKPVKRTAV